MKETWKDNLTVPTAFTLARLALSPWQAKKLYRDPRGRWPKAAFFIATDVIDGKLAKLEDRFPQLARFGFRRSELGRKMDPVTDKIVISQLLVAGMLANVVPKSLGAAALTQKTAISLHVLSRTTRGEETHVTNFGRYSELVTNAGFGGFFVAESFDEPTQKQLIRGAATAIALSGIAGAIAADVGYSRQ